MTPEDLYTQLKASQEKKGYYFNSDKELVLNLLKGVLTNKQRYGYGSCPCRLATRDKERDRPIVCPCEYRDEDVARYGRCYCMLYVSQAVAQGQETPQEVIAERWLRI